jgi:phosphoribosylformylglycinamidine synthase
MWFGEDQGIYVVTSAVDATTFIERVNAFGVVAEHIGETGGGALAFATLGSSSASTVPLEDLRRAHEGFFPALMGGALTVA